MFLVAQLALYRKYRSQTFEDLIGQEHIVRTIQSALSTGRIAQTFLFTGPRGTGKTSSARLLAKALNCEKGPTPTPCNVCEACLTITQGHHPDVIEMDAASDSGVDDVREKIVDVVSYAPMMGKYKVFIIDEVHDLSPKAFDALLKTVEEPPAHMVFILATTEFNKVPATIRSRCQKYEFHRATIKNLVDRLNFVCQSEGVTAEPAAVAAIARMADGGFRDALTLLEQAILVSDGAITTEVVYDQLGLVNEQAVDGLLEAISKGEIARIIEILQDIARSGRDPRALLESMLHRLGDLTRISYQVSSDEFDATRESSMHELAARLGRPFLISIRSALAEAHKVIRDISLPRLWLESEVIRLSQPQPGRTSTPAPVVNKAPQPRETAPAPSVAVVEPTPEAKPVEVHEPVSTPPAVEAGDVWQQLLASIPVHPATGMPAPHKMRLASSALIEDTGDKLVVSLENQMHYEWFNDDIKRTKFLQDLLPKLGREGASIEFVLKKKTESIVIESEAVELPVDGPRLERIVREVFNVPVSPGEGEEQI
ncbi:MAG: DNA polymerase III subunit gamma/tau [Armatimonadetes bacterium Cent15-Ar3]|nr:MAG: DNA polymerase III subunit gamma/tau [Armatimonadetes bacterium Cent15-Ar3]